jgi:hypothetical protein
VLFQPAFGNQTLSGQCTHQLKLTGLLPYIKSVEQPWPSPCFTSMRVPKFPMSVILNLCREVETIAMANQPPFAH